MSAATSVARGDTPHFSRPPGRTRRTVVAVVLVVLSVVVALIALGIGDYPLSVGEVVHALLHDDGIKSTIVRDGRLPRIVADLSIGAALGASGALFQALTRNPLGSPDVIGFSSGSFTGVLIGFTVLPSLNIPNGLWALAGGIITAVVVYLLAYQRGVQGMRLIVTGIAITAMLQAVNVWLQLRSDANVSMTASAWAAGATDTVGWGALRPGLIGMAICLLLVPVVVKALHQLELGDDHAVAHGVRVEPMRLAVILLGVALTAIPTAVVGPIAFVALAAPQLAKRLAGGAGLPITQSALTGAALLIMADQIAAHAFPHEIPVGVVTIVLGGIYLMVLLLRGVTRKAS